MGHIRETVFINAPIERVWKFITDYQRLTEWQTNLVETRDLLGVPGEVGFSYVAVYQVLGRRLEGRFKITHVEAPRLIKESGEMPGVGHAITETVLESVADGGTLSTFAMDYEMGAGFVGGLADRFVFERAIERDIRHSGENMKALVEAEALVPVG